MPAAAHIAASPVMAMAAGPASAAFGSVAVNERTKNFGYSKGQARKSAAATRALEFCKTYSKGAAGCQVVLTTRRCASVSRGPKTVFVAEARTAKAAEADALKHCAGIFGATKCSVAQSFCAH